MNLNQEIIKRYIELTILQMRNSLTLDQAHELAKVKEAIKNDADANLKPIGT